MVKRDATRSKKTYSFRREAPRTAEDVCAICNTILNGVGAPAAGLGLIDDLYINTSTMELYGPKASDIGGWGTPIPLNGSGTVPGGLNTQIQFNDSNTFGGDTSLTYNKITQTLNTKNLTVDTDSLVVAGSKVGIGTATPGYELEVVGEFAATVKSFVVNHPNKPGWKLRHGTLEGPENGVYVRGRTTERTVILPDYWTNFVDENSITVQITPINMADVIYVTSASIGSFTVDCSKSEIEYYYVAQAQRKDCVFEVEYEIK